MKAHYTLEAHLRKLSKHDDTAQHLRSIFDLQKQKMEKHLLSVVTTFPTYSSHDTAHCSRIIMAMERILDKPIIKQLSSTDTFLLLICAYMHDVGMLYTDKEVRSIWGTNDFKLFLDSCKERNSELSDAVSKIYEPFPTNRGSEWPLEVRQSITLLLMEYFRPKHGKRIETVTDLTRNRTAQLLRIEDSYLPDRIIRLINTICRLHNDKFSELLTVIPFEDSFGRDSFHPRMVAYMLRLCDLCDTDNDRFNKIGIYTFGNLSDSNLPHFFKHKSVETLHISPTSIEVSANITYDKIEYSCRNEWMSDEKDEKKQNKRIDRVFRQTVREHINWKRWMEQEIQNGRLNYNKIFPANWGFSLPEIKYIIKIDGKESASTSENLRFLFSQEKAFDLIESISIYQNDSMIFLRELIQNSIDATKIQLWRFITENNKELDHNEILTPFDVEEHYHGIFSKFPIEINLEYNSETQCAEFSIVDKGIGISVEELKSNILITGTSWNDRECYKSELEKMPDWLKPTGAFGIGMHSVFYVTDEINILTKSNMEELPNQIVLCSGKKDGFAFCRKIKQLIPRGTKISFEFKITQNEMEAFVDTSCPVFLRNEEESIIAAARDTIEKWLVTPLFPVFFNQQLVVDSITKQYDFRQLCNQTVRNRIPGRQNAEYDSDNYDFAFSNNYQSVIIWDRKNECLMHFSIGEGAGSSTSFHAKGIFITQDNSWDIEENDSIVSSTLDIDLFDALACDTKLVMDAARTSIKKQYLVHCNNLVSKAEQQCINLYLQLLDTIIHNEGYTNLRQSISMAARLFKKKSNRTNSIWDVSEDLFCKFFSDCQMSANAKQRVILQFCFMIVDEISFVTNRRVLREKKDISTIKKLVHSTSYFWLSILDDALQSYSHYVETGERELSSYASIYLSRFHYLIDYYLCYLLIRVSKGSSAKNRGVFWNCSADKSAVSMTFFRFSEPRFC